MWPAIYEFVRLVIAVIFCAAAVKLSDDFLDKDLDRHSGQTNWAETLGHGTMFYAILLIVFAAGINAPVSLSLFLSSYIIGMFNDLRSFFPSKLTGFQESVLIFIIGSVIFGWQLMLFSLLFMFSVQLFDDCVDVHTDILAGNRNFAHRFGIVECLLFGIMNLLISWWLNEQLFLPVFCGTAIFYASMLFFQEARV